MRVIVPRHIKETMLRWRIGNPTEIEDRPVQMVQGTTDGKYPVNFYFDDKTGLLVRLVRFTESPVGLNPTQIDYSDYREVSGIKVPFHWLVSWLDGQETFDLTDVTLNASVDAAKFARPAIAGANR